LSNLDALLRLEMRAELKGVLAESKTTTIYVTHDQVEAMSLADRISVMNGGRIVQAANPVEVYRNPAARFVGSFIGNPPMNFLTAQPAGAGKWQVAGQVFDGPAAAAAEFAIRPEDLHPSESGLPAEVRVVEPLGPHTLVTASVAGQPFRAVLESTLTPRPGDMIHLAPVPDRIRWFDPATQSAL
jgi:multiple sugar transport system ATP-binding protein